MSPRARAWTLAFATVAACAFVCGVIFFTLCGCAASLPDEPGYVITNTTKDASRWSYNAP